MTFKHPGMPADGSNHDGFQGNEGSGNHPRQWRLQRHACKNLGLLAGKPLIAHTIESARQTRIILSAPGGQGAIREIAELIEEKLEVENNDKND